MNKNNFIEPLVSVIITCYNHGRFLPVSINSVLNQQGYSNYEIIVVDDGSVDNTREVCESFPQVIYVFQENAGLSAARNTGIEKSKGDFLLFLDADDWLLPEGISINSKFLVDNPEVAFVSGGHKFFYEKENLSLDITSDVSGNYYCGLLERNFIAMHACVMYRRQAFDNIRYNTALPACEDYDVYLRMARIYPVLNHQQLIAVYRIHGANMSANSPMMLKNNLHVLELQQPYLKTSQERKCYKKGIENACAYYCKEIYDKLISELAKNSYSRIELWTLFRYDKMLFYKYTRRNIRFKARRFLKSLFKPA